MSLKTLYVQSLKKKGSEEIFDLILFRPLGFLTAYGLRKTPITPNAITILAMLCGIASGFSYYFYSFYLGALFLFFSNCFDCADGQLARLKKTSSQFGMILDGFADYIVYISINLGAFLALVRDRGNLEVFWTDWLFWAAWGAGISTIIQAALFDRYRVRYTGSGSLVSLKKDEETILKLKQSKPFFIKQVLIFFYLIYLKKQIQSAQKETNLFVKKRFIRLLSFTGSTTHITLFIFFSAIQYMQGYLIAVGVVMNIYLAFLFLFKNKLNMGE